MELRTYRASNDYQNDSRRASPRRMADNCISMIDGKAYPVHNWSDGGILIHADDRLFSVDAPIEITLKFRLRDRLMDIAQRGKIIRKTRDRLAIQFEPVQRDVSQKFKQVIDDYVTREFMESQLA